MRRALLLCLLLPGCIDPWETDLYDCQSSRWLAQGQLPGLYERGPQVPADVAARYEGRSPVWKSGDYLYTGPEPLPETFPRPPVPEDWEGVRIWRFWWLAPADDGGVWPTGFLVEHDRPAATASYPPGTSQDQMIDDLHDFLEAATDLNAQERAQYGQPGGPAIMATDAEPTTRDFRTAPSQRAVWTIEIDGDRVHVWDHLLSAAPDEVVATDVWLFQLGGPGWELYRAFGPYRNVQVFVDFSDRVIIGADGGPWNQTEVEARVEEVLADHGAHLVRDQLSIDFRPDGGCEFGPGPDDA